MQSGKKASDGGAGTGEGLEPALAALQTLISENPTPEQFCVELSKVFQVQRTEIALFRLQDGRLKFLFPTELKTAGSIPLSSSSVAAHTAVSQRSDLYNNFAKVKHASVFEMVKLSHKEEPEPPDGAPIQRLITAPILDEAEERPGSNSGLPQGTGFAVRRARVYAGRSAAAGMCRRSRCSCRIHAERLGTSGEVTLTRRQVAGATSSLDRVRLSPRESALETRPWRAFPAAEGRRQRAPIAARQFQSVPLFAGFDDSCPRQEPLLARYCAHRRGECAPSRLAGIDLRRF